jgi:integrase
MKGHFRKRGSKWTFVLDLGRDEKTGKRKQKWFSGYNTKKEAEKACAKIIAELSEGKYKEESTQTIQDFILDFMETQVKPSTRITTYNNQSFIVNKHILPELGPMQLNKLTPAKLQRFYAKKSKEGLAASYIRSMHAILSKAFRTAVTWGLLEKNVVALVKPPRIETRDISIWTMEEAQEFLSFAEDRKFFIAYVLAIYTGMRRGEILGLRWRDCDLERGTVSIQQTVYKSNNEILIQEPKTKGSKRTITLPDYAISCLKKHRVRQNEYKLRLGSAYTDHDLVMANWNGTPVDPADINKDFAYAIKKAGLPRIRFHDLRHTHATILLRLGENPKVVSERLGHAEVGITLDTYSHVLPDMQKNLAQNFEIAMKEVKKKRS